MTMGEWHEASRESCRDILLRHGYTVNTDGHHDPDGTGVRVFREYNREKFALGMVDLVGMKGGKIEIVAEIEEDTTLRSILGDVAVVDMANWCLIHTGSNSKMVPLEGAILFVITPALKDERAKRQAKTLAMMLRDTYNLTNLSDFIVTDELEFEEELKEMELYMV